MRKKVEQWNIRFPLDYWYRKKFNIRFGSEEHLNTKVVHMVWEWLELKMYDNIKQVEPYKKGDWLKSRDIDVDNLDNIDFSKINL